MKKLEKLEFYHTESRIKYEKPLKVLEDVVINPVELYFDQLRNTENVNGCIYNTKIELNFTDNN